MFWKRQDDAQVGALRGLGVQRQWLPLVRDMQSSHLPKSPAPHFGASLLWGAGFPQGARPYILATLGNSAGSATVTFGANQLMYHRILSCFGASFHPSLQLPQPSLPSAAIRCLRPRATEGLKHVEPTPRLNQFKHG